MPQKTPEIQSVQEPDTLLTAPPAPKGSEGKMWIVKKVHKHMVVGGQRLAVVDPESGVNGFLPVFTDYEKALSYVDGDRSLLAGIEPVT